MYHSCPSVPTGSPSRGGDVAVYVFAVNQLSLPTHFYTVLASVSVCMALSIAFLSTTSLSRLIFALLVLSNTDIFMKVSLSPDMILRG